MDDWLKIFNVFITEITNLYSQISPIKHFFKITTLKNKNTNVWVPPQIIKSESLVVVVGGDFIFNLLQMSPKHN